ncbi:MAG: DMT family transporter [bacterium]
MFGPNDWKVPQGFPALHGAVALFGLAALFGKWVPAHPVVIVFARVLVATAAFLPVMRLLQHTRAPLSMPPSKSLSMRERLLVGACGGLLAFHWFAFFHSIQVSTVAIGLLSYSTAPVFAALMEPLCFRERFSWPSLGAGLLVVAGVALIVPRWSPGDARAMGVFWGILAGFSFAALSLANRQLVRRHASIRIAFYQDAGAMILLAPLVPFFWRPLAWDEIGLLVALGLFCTALAHTLFIQALRTVTARVAAIASALEPVYGIALAWMLLDERPDARVFAGGCVIVAAVVWASLPKFKPQAPQRVP